LQEAQINKLKKLENKAKQYAATPRLLSLSLSLSKSVEAGRAREGIITR
jgi:hypothetical protein